MSCQLKAVILNEPGGPPRAFSNAGWRVKDLGFKPLCCCWLPSWYFVSFVVNRRNAKARARKIRLLLFDVDGVMTDGSIWLFPAPAGAAQNPRVADAPRHEIGGYEIVSSTMIEAKGFNAHDGSGISLAQLGGLKTGLITKRISETVALRARDLRLDHVYQGIADKLSTFREILKQEGISEAEAAYVGDDIIDLPVMRRCGLAVAVPNAREAVKKQAHLITEHSGGHGAIRDTVEFILSAQGKLEQVIERYLQARGPVKKE
jgi:3-deoxy-D-manno-octulosonate 8-phosphate phosphatase (KDO 8-P phosphatase)